jgi:hypothetical protein
MEEVCERENLKAALRQVKANKGSPGVDGMTVGGIRDYLKQHWPAIREQLLNGTYEPMPVRRVEIPKPDGGGVRKLGINARADQPVLHPPSIQECPDEFQQPLWKGLHKEVRFRHCSVTSRSTNSTGSWSAGVIVSFDMRTTVISTSVASGRATALFASFTLSLSFCVMNCVMPSITRCPAGAEISGIQL